MRLERLTVLNFCKYRYRQFDFGPGMTGIIGPNGSGKSNILDAVRFAMTGENPYSGNKLANICYLAPPTEKSYVELTFSHGSVRATARRNLRPDRPAAEMTIEGGRTIKGDAEVTRHIEEILGIPCEILNDIVIVAQREIFGFLDKLPAKRAEMFQRIFRTEIAAILAKLLGDHLKTVDVPTVAVGRDVILTKITDWQHDVTVTTQQLAGCQTFAQIQQTRDLCSNVLRDAAEYDRFNRNRQTLESQLALAVELQLKAQGDLTKLLEERATVQAAAEGNTTAANEARVKLATLRQSRQTAQLHDTATKRVDYLNQLLLKAQNETPQPPAMLVADVPAETKRLQDEYVTLVRLQQLVSSIRGDMVECPTCFTPTTQLKERIAAAPAQIQEIQTRYTAAENAVKATLAYQRQVEQHTAYVQQLQNDLTTARQHAAQLPPLESVTVDEAALQQVLINEKTFQDGLVEYEQNINRLTRDVAHFDGQLAEMRQQQRVLMAQPPALVTPERVQQAQQEIAACDQAAGYRRQLESQLAVAQTQVQQLTKDLEATDALLVKSQKRRDWHAFCNSMRDVLHKDAAPRFVTQRNLQRLQHRINEHLELFDSEYRVQADEGLSFTAFFPDGNQQPAERISEGQQVILALTFRLALNLMYAENLGALYLDEPTAYLDEDHIKAFEPVLNRLREYTASRGLQLIMVTHERELAPLFDSVIKL